MLSAAVCTVTCCLSPARILGENPDSARKIYGGEISPMTRPFRKAREIASHVLAPSTGQNDKAGRFSTEAVESLGESGVLGLMLPVSVAGSGLGSRTFAAVLATLGAADASVAMVNLMQVVGAATISAARPGAAQAVAPHCARSLRDAIYLLSLSVKPARAVTSGLLYRAPIGMVTACESTQRNRG
jgi:hypothetical protein